MANTKITKSNRNSAARSTARRNNNGMEDRNMRFMALVAVLAVALVATIGVAVAAFSQDLHINGTAKVVPTNWDVHFENLSAVSTNGDAAEVTTPSIDSTTTKIETYDVTLKTPGDYVEYTFDIKNGGDVDAKIGSITMKTGGTSSSTKLTCNIAAGGDTTKAQTTCGNLHYTLTWTSAGNPAVKVNDTLIANQKRTAKLKLELDAGMDPTDLPDKDLTISDLGVVINYVQK